MVAVHWNRTRRCWSVREGKSPIWHTKSMTLFAATFRVRPGGRRRCVQEHRRNVHAFACGLDMGCAEPDLVESLGMLQVTYNPYREDHFIVRSTGEHIKEARWVMLLADGTVWATPNGVQKGKTDLA